MGVGLGGSSSEFSESREVGKEREEMEGWTGGGQRSREEKGNEEGNEGEKEGEGAGRKGGDEGG